MPDLRHSEHCPICHGYGDYLDEVDPDQGPIYEPCPIAEDEWLRKQKTHAKERRPTWPTSRV